MQDLKGKTITTVDGIRIVLGKIAGYGAQGVVYEDSTGNNMVKFYFPTGSDVVDEDIAERLRFIRDVKMPANFVSISSLIDTPYIGYVMNKVSDHKPLNSYLIQDRNLSFAEWYNRGHGLWERLLIGYIIAKSFSELEAQNLSYCDISGNNILVKAGGQASVKMIDVDNIYIAGKGSASVLGTERYIAPEVISRHRNPDVLSDNYSLAVILFELLRVGHPYISDDVLDGTPEDEMEALAGRYDYVTEENSTNMLPEDIVFTDKLKKLFYKCFVDGKNNRILRPSAREFESALLEASNKVIKCPSCGAWHYPRKSGKKYEPCPWCDQPSKPKARLNFFDLMIDGDDYRTGKISEEVRPKLINTYIVREGKNRIKSLYVHSYNDPANRLTVENYMTVVKNNDGYYAYNEFSKKGIKVQHTGMSESVDLQKNKPVKLEDGSCIYFESESGNNPEIEIGGRKYSYIRMAKFKLEDE